MTGPDVNLEIDWPKLTSHDAGAVYFDNLTGVNYTFGFAIPNMILFNDLNDTGKIDTIPEEYRLYVPMTDFMWKIKETFSSSQHEAGVLFETVEFRGEPMPNDTRILIEVVSHGFEGRNKVLPHLITTPDSAQFDIVLDHLILNLTGAQLHNDEITAISGFENPRWAMELVPFSMEDKDDVDEGYTYATFKSLDDEHSPGVFNVDEITTFLSRQTKHGGYLQWRPVSYLTSDRDINHSTFPNINHTFPSLEELDEPINKSLAFAVFGENLVRRMVSTKIIVSYGEPKDNFYTGSKYTTWTLAYGVGIPPEETFSTLVIIVISLGIGIPSLVFVVGGSFVGYRKCRDK
ncbi:hypothetical protein SK128_025130 [Halocaridina rubra]|uniref:Uncharacterized protein n=1 Tax=Halocaridina rubra TaxID=373956 RepID=A0AAN8X0N4_HALRR